MKKLWARSRSRRRGSQGKVVEKKISTEKLSSPNGKAVSSKTAPPMPEIPRDYRTGRQRDDNVRPGSSNKTQPMLIGVSRPSGQYSRPGTSGSLQNAVSSAADKVAKSPSSDFRQSNATTKSPRYIDIFNISNPKTAFKTYNEDVAVRNLDTNILAQKVKKDGYVPSSKYQEEVAARNAAPPLRGSMDQARLSSLEGYRPNYEELKAHRAPKEHEVEGRLANDEDIRRFHEAEKATQYEYRSRRQLLGESAQSMTSAEEIQQMVAAETYTRGRSKRSSQNATVLQTQSAFRHAQPDPAPPGSVIPDSSEPSDHRFQSEDYATRQEFVQPLITRIAASGVLPGYQTSPSELSQPREADAQARFQQSASERPGLRERGPSALSTASSVGRSTSLSHQAIIDLAGDNSDGTTNGYPESYRNCSAGVERAHTDALTSSVPITEDQDGDVRSEARENQLVSASVQPSVQYRPPKTLSAISTVASLSPKTKSASQPMAAPTARSSAVSRENRKPVSTNLFTVAETEPEVEEYGSTADELTKTIQRAQPARAQEISGSLEDASVPAVERRDFATGQKGLEHRPVVSPSPAASLRTLTQSTTPGRIQQSPESLHSSDFINPSSSFGVRTRDFAVSPGRSAPPALVRSEQEPNTSAKVKPPLRPKSVNVIPNGETILAAEINDPTVLKYSSGFNEEDFRRKQEQARAALVRLQQSLNEEFLSPPRETRKTRTNGVRRHANSTASNDGRPYAPPPTSIFTQIRELHRPSTSQANGYHESRESSRPRTSLSVHEQVTQPRPLSPASTSTSNSTSAATIKPVRGQRSPDPDSREIDRQTSKGKEKVLSGQMSEMRQLVNDMRNTKLAMPSLSQQRIYDNGISPQPRSPGEISLSAFPFPTSVHPRQASAMSGGLAYQNTTTASNISSYYKSRHDAAPSPVVSPTPSSPDPQQRRILSRRGSMKSQASAMTSTSQHSIPFHLIPERGSSMRDILVREDESEG